MKKFTKRDFWLLMVQLIIWMMMLFFPAVTTILATHETSATIQSMRMTWYNLQSPLILYFINFYVLWTFLFEKQRYKTFLLVNVILFAALNYRLFFLKDFYTRSGMELPHNWWIGMFAGLFIYFILNCAAVTVAITIRHFLKTREVMR